MSPQNAKILSLLKRQKSKGVTPSDALGKVNCWRLAARVYDLRMMGYDILTVIDHNKNARYFLK